MEINFEMLATTLIFFYQLLSKIGPFFLFFALVLGIIGLPIPDELLLVGSGSLVAHGKLHLLTTLAAALLGSIAGITISYLLGRLAGFVIIKKYGTTLNITETKVNTVQRWFETVGKWILLIGYYIPLFRHVIGFVAGLSKMHYRSFALFAYTGAVIWSLTFFSIGFFFFDRFRELFHK